MARRAVAKAPATPRLPSWTSACQWSRLTHTEKSPAALSSRARAGVSVEPVVKSLTAQPSEASAVMRTMSLLSSGSPPVQPIQKTPILLRSRTTPRIVSVSMGAPLRERL